MERLLIFEADPSASYGNARMSLGVAVALAYLTRRKLSYIGAKPLWSGPNPVFEDQRGAGSSARHSTILDLLALPPAVAPTAAEPASSKSVIDLDLPDLHTCVISADDRETPDRAELQAFANGRRRILRSKDLPDAPVVRFAGRRSVAQEGYLFHLSPAQHGRLLQVSAGLRLPRELHDLATEIADHLGRFHAIHLRRAEFLDTYYRGVDTSAARILDTLTSVVPKLDTVLLFTDSPEEETVAGPIGSVYRNLIRFDRIVRDVRSWQERLLDMPWAPDVALAALSGLVAARAVEFLGSGFSTFTAAIHRERRLQGAGTPVRFLFNPLPRGADLVCGEFPEDPQGHYSWNRASLPIDPAAHHWIRLWPESCAMREG